MNKQAVTFLGLFTLILLVSVYYIIVPVETDTNVSVANIEDKISIMETSLQDERENIVSENNNIIASSSSTSDDIEVALNNIAAIENYVKQEEDISKLLKENGFSRTYVEIAQKCVKVVVVGKESKAKANKVIKLILDKLGNDYLVEVKFIVD